MLVQRKLPKCLCFCLLLQPIIGKPTHPCDMSPSFKRSETELIGNLMLMNLQDGRKNPRFFFQVVIIREEGLPIRDRGLKPTFSLIGLLGHIYHWVGSPPPLPPPPPPHFPLWKPLIQTLPPTPPPPIIRFNSIKWKSN